MPKPKTPPARTGGVSKSLNQEAGAARTSTTIVAFPSGRASDKSLSTENSLTWRGVELPRISPGIYDGVCVGFQGPERIVRYGRFGLRLEFELLSEPVRVSRFYNFGRGAAPEIRRHSDYWKDWVMVNGDFPKRGQDMGPALFVEPGRIFKLEVTDCSVSPERQPMVGCEAFSRVRKVLSVSYA